MLDIVVNPSAHLDDTDNGKGPQWPPHPARVFCALAEAVRSDDDRYALQWLEQQPPPQIEVGPFPSAIGRSAQHLPPVTLRWAQTASQPVRTALRVLTDRTPAVGGASQATPPSDATSWSDLGSGRRRTAPSTAAVQFEPCALHEADLLMRVPFPGFLAGVESRQNDRPAWEASRYVGYRIRRTSSQTRSQAVPTPPVYTDVVVFTLVGCRPSGRLAHRFTKALRSAVLRAAGRSAPDVLHGHGADGLPHVAFLALPDVGEPGSDGHLMGVAVAVPDLPAPERALVMRAVRGFGWHGKAGLTALRVPGAGAIELAYQQSHVRPWAVSPERWRQGSQRWTTATPMVLDHFPKRPDQTEHRIREAVHRVGLPEPLQVRFDTEPLISGGVALRPPDLPDQARGKLFCHVDLTFGDPVVGPVLVGAGRYLGAGLFAPNAVQIANYGAMVRDRRQ
jgi:CRISPR-associated protein Csb2